MTGTGEQARVGLCATCAHVKRIDSDRGAMFYLCQYSRLDPSFPKYPPLPVRACPAHQPDVSAQPNTARSETRPKAVVSWSGGKDACVALHRARAEYDVVGALTMMDESGERSRAHGVREEVMRAQVTALGVQWITRRCSWDTYEDAFIDALHEARNGGAAALVGGDILYPEHRQWVEGVCAAASLSAVEPNFGSRTIDIYRDFLGMGGVARIIAVSAKALGADWLFRALDEACLDEFAALGVDACGENGEYHTLVTSCPAFSRPIDVEPGERVFRRGYWAVDVRLKDASG